MLLASVCFVVIGDAFSTPMLTTVYAALRVDNSQMTKKQLPPPNKLTEHFEGRQPKAEALSGDA